MSAQKRRDPLLTAVPQPEEAPDDSVPGEPLEVERLTGPTEASTEEPSAPEDDVLP